MNQKEKTLAEASESGFQDLLKHSRNRHKTEEEKKNQLLIKAAQLRGILPEAKKVDFGTLSRCGAPALIYDDEDDIEWDEEGDNESKNLQITFDPNEKTKRSGFTRFTKVEKIFRTRYYQNVFSYYMSNGINISKFINTELIKALSMSIVPWDMCKTFSEERHLSSVQLEVVTKWFHSVFLFERNERNHIHQRIFRTITSKRGEREELCIVFASIIKAFNFPVRIIKVIEPVEKKSYKRKDTLDKVKKRKKTKIELEVEESYSECSDNTTSSSAGLSKYKYNKSKKKVINLKKNRLPVGTEWCEVWCGNENNGKWTHVDPVNSIVNRHNDFEKNGNKVSPVARILGFEEDYVTDVSRRYVIPGCQNQNPWLNERINKFNKESHYLRNTRNFDVMQEREEVELERLLDERCKVYPKTKTGFKDSNYILESKIGKYRALVPDAEIVSHFRSEPFYHKADVCEVRSVEGWIHRGFVVRKEEKSNPYKIVNLRKETPENKDLPKKTSKLYGKWQTDKWVQPEAKDGKVPLNEYGNVEIPPVVPKLPLGTVYLPFPYMDSLCKELDIHYAPALTGFSYRGGIGRPKIFGVVICEEFEKTVMDAYNEFLQRCVAEDAESKLKKGENLWKKVLTLLHKRMQVDQAHQNLKLELKQKEEDEELHLYKAEKEEI